MARHPDSAEAPLVPRRWRIAGWLALAVVLGVGFAAYSTPALRIQWDTLLAMCGFS